MIKCFFCTKNLFKANHPAIGLRFNSNSPAPSHVISPRSDRHLSAPIRASGCLCLHVVPITPDHEVAIVFGCCSALAPGTPAPLSPGITSGYMCRVMTA